MRASCKMKMALRTGEVLRKIFKGSPNWRPLSEEELDKLKHVMLTISDDFVALCQKYGLNYCMAYGTALGAVRHKGYIPWDDDVDFFMPREDYMKFMVIAEKELGNQYYFRSVSKGDKVSFPTLHMRKKGTYYVNYGDLIITDSELPETRGIYIDIAPLDNSCNIAFIRNAKAYLSLALLFAESCIIVRNTVNYLRSHDILIDNEDFKILQKKFILGHIFSIIPMYKWMKLYDKLNAKNRNKNSKYMISYCGMKNIARGTYKREDMLPFKPGCFEGRLWNLPKNTDAYLKCEYDDYMVIPKEEVRKIHPVFYLNFDTSMEKSMCSLDGENT